jgi:hypothetical protein
MDHYGSVKEFIVHAIKEIFLLSSLK